MKKYFPVYMFSQKYDYGYLNRHTETNPLFSIPVSIIGAFPTRLAAPFLLDPSPSCSLVSSLPA